MCVTTVAAAAAAAAATADVCRYYDAVMMRNEFAILQAKHNGA
jgi:hypothetical protein